jgi:hypothetical protein
MTPALKVLESRIKFKGGQAAVRKMTKKCTNSAQTKKLGHSCPSFFNQMVNFSS